MTRFRAEWVDARGERVEAELEGRDRTAVLEGLEPGSRAGLVRLAPAEDEPAAGADVAWAGRALAGLLRQGVPLGPALRHLARAGDGAVARELARAAAAADEGATLAAVLERGPLGPALASPLVRGMLEAGERASRLPDLLLEASRLASRLAAARRRAVDALAYPTLVAALGVVLLAVTVTLVGPALGDFVAVNPSRGPGGQLVAALAWLGARPALAWAGALGALGALVLGRRAAGGGLVPLRLRTVREAALLQALAALVAGGLAPGEAAALLDDAAPGLLPPDAARGLREGAPPADALAAAQVVDLAEKAALAAGARAGPAALAATLRELADLRLTAVEDRARALAASLGLGLELTAGAGVLLVALPFLGSPWT